MQKTIFVVDDSAINLITAKNALKDYYRVMTMLSAAKMFELLEKRVPDLILLDIEMPDMDGFEALHKLKTNGIHADIPVIFLTSMTDDDVEVRGFQIGAVDFINKPFSVPVLINRIKTHLDIDELIRERTAQLQQKTDELHKSAAQLETLKNGIVSVLAGMVESRDKVTGDHIGRTSVYMWLLINEMIESGVHSDELLEMDVDLLVSSASLHDVGKIAISDVILNKPGKLTYDEFEIMKTHCEKGEYVIDQISALTDNVDFLYYAKIFIGSHHERWDGTGYPRGLSKTDIPFLGQIMSIVDVYDALTSERPYKKALDADKAVSIIMEGAGTQFDPQIAEVFLEVKDLFKLIKL